MLFYWGVKMQISGTNVDIANVQLSTKVKIRTIDIKCEKKQTEGKRFALSFHNFIVENNFGLVFSLLFFFHSNKRFLYVCQQSGVRGFPVSYLFVCFFFSISECKKAESFSYEIIVLIVREKLLNPLFKQ